MTFKGGGGGGGGVRQFRRCSEHEKVWLKVFSLCAGDLKNVTKTLSAHQAPKLYPRNTWSNSSEILCKVTLTQIGLTPINNMPLPFGLGSEGEMYGDSFYMNTKDYKNPS